MKHIISKTITLLMVATLFSGIGNFSDTKHQPKGGIIQYGHGDPWG